jgi:hypothetical protein
VTILIKERESERARKEVIQKQVRENRAENGCTLRCGVGETAFKINIEIRTKWRGNGKGRIITKSGAGGKLFRLIFILFNDEIFGILPPWQMEVFFE